MKNSIIYTVVGLTVGSFICAIICFKGCNPEVIESTTSDTIRTSDTVIIRDTIRIDKPKPYKVEVARVDTLIVRDTVRVAIPIERKTFRHPDYKAIIEGYKPELINIEIYKTNTFVRDTIRISNTITKRYKPPNWVLSAGVGVGYSAKGFEPYVGLNVGYVIWSK